MKITKLALIGLLFAGALFTTGCEKSPADDAADAVEEATEAAE
jgi:PBP1b-binding outer membrane lipoprotein LpoB